MGTRKNISKEVGDETKHVDIENTVHPGVWDMVLQQTRRS